MFQIVAFLLKAGARSNTFDGLGMTPMHVAAGCGYLSIVKLLLTACRSPDLCAADGSTPLHAAAFGGHLDVVKLLVAHGAAVNAVDKKGRTPLHSAAKSGTLSVVQYLVEKKVPLNQEDAKGISPTFVAASAGNLDVLRFLFQAGVSPRQVLPRRAASSVSHDSRAASEQPTTAQGAPFSPRTPTPRTPMGLQSLCAQRVSTGTVRHVVEQPNPRRVHIC